MLYDFPVVLTTDPGDTELDHKLKVIHERKRAGKESGEAGAAVEIRSSRDRVVARNIQNKEG